MADATQGRVQEISLVEGFTAVVRQGENTIEIKPDGTITSNGVSLIPASGAANDDAGTAGKLRIGQKMPDGSKYAGLSPDTGKPMFAAADDAPLTMSWLKAMEYAGGLDAHGHHDWRVPTKAELNQLFQRRAEIGGFNETGSDPAGWYWSSSQNSDNAWTQSFSDGYQEINYKGFDSSLRCIR